MKCTECGRQIPDGALFCKYCGTRVQAGEEPQQDKNYDFEKSQKGVRRSTGQKSGKGLIVALVAILIIAIGVLAAVLIWRNGNSANDVDNVPSAGDELQTQDNEQEQWTASITPENGEVEVGSNLMLNAAMDQESDKVTVKSITWKSSDTSVATVSNGIVYGVSEGTVQITASIALSDGSSVQAQTRVTVIQASVVYTATISPESASLKLGDTTTLTVDLDQNLQEGVEAVSTVWSTDNSAVAVVSNGKVSAVGEGSTIISVTINLSNGQAASANAKITVTANQQTQQNGSNQSNSNQNNNNSNNNHNGNSGNNNSTPQTSSDYILPGSDTTLISYDTLRALSNDQLRLARNEIYARHGRRFDDAQLQAYFDGKSWYHGTIAPEDFDANVLSKVELQNIDRIKEVEASR